MGTHLEAGLPNITGSWTSEARRAMTKDWTGAYSGIDYGNCMYSDNNSAGYGGVSFNASNGETKTDGTLKTSSEHHVYGASNTVQPDSVCVNYIIKY